MNTTIDQRVVEMQFDNKHFESNVSTTMSTLEKLKQSLNLTGASKGLEEVGYAAKKCDMSPLGSAVETVKAKFSALQVMGVTALSNITNQAVNAGKRIVSSLTIDPIKTGFSEYETQINAIQTILANTESKGTTLEDVNGALDELNTYADKTIYNFTEMTRNIGTFTAAGVDLDTSTQAIKGIANLAAVSGSTSQQASTAMYQLSQAMASGTVKLMDWNSVVNAGMGGQVFQDALKETAKVHGIAIDDIIKKNGSFRESLSDGWLTTEILTDTLAKFTGDLSEEQLRSQGYTEEQIKSIMKLGETANDAATKVKTFTQLWDTLKEAAQSGWTQTWEILVGDFEEAKELLTSVSDVIGEMINKSAESRNKMLEDWKVLGGRDDIIESIKNVFQGLISILTPVKEAFREIFPPLTADQLKSFSEGLKNLTEKFKIGDETADKLKRTFKGLFAVIDIVKQVVVAVFKGVGSLFGSFGDLGGGILDVTAAIGDWLVSLSSSIKESDILNKVLQGVATIIKSVLKLFTSFVKFVGGKIVSPGMELFHTLVENISGALSGVSDTAGSMKDGVVTAFDAMSSALEGCSFFKLIETLWNGLVKVGSGIVGALGGLIGTIIGKLSSGNLQGFMDFINALIAGGAGIGLIQLIKKFKKPLEDIGGFLDTIKGKFSDILGGVGDSLQAFTQQLKAETLMTIAKAIALLAASLIILSFIDAEKLGTAISAMSALFAELLIAMSITTKLTKQKGLMAIATAMVSISTAMLILAVAIKLLSTMTWEEMGVGLISITVGLGAMVAAVNLLPESKINKAAKAIKKLSSAMLILAVAIKILSTMTWEEMGVGLISMVVGLGAMVAAVNLLPESKVNKAARAIVTMSTAMLILSASIKILSTLSWSQLAIGLAGVSAGLAAMVIAIHLLPKDTGIRTLGIATLAASLIILAGALKIMATMSWGDFAKSMAVLGGAITILAAGLYAMKNSIAGSLAMTIATVALMALVPVLVTLGALSWSSIVKGLVSLAGTFAVLGIAGALLKPVIGTILGLAVAITLIGVGVLTAGVGLIALGTGLTALSVGLTALISSLAAMPAIIVKLVEALVVGLIKGIGNGIVAFCEAIANGSVAIGKAITAVVLTLCDVLIECTPAIVNTVFQLIVSLLSALTEYTPKIVAGLFDFLIAVIRSLGDYVPKFVKELVNVIMSMFVGAIDALKSVDPDVLIKGILSVGLMAGVMAALAAVAALVPGAMAGVLGMGLVIAELGLVLAAIGALAQIPGLTWLIGEGGDLLQAIGTAIGQFVGGIIGGIGLGVTSSLPEMANNLSTFMKNLQPFVDGAKLIDESVLGGVKSLVGVVLAITAANVLEGLTSWITGGSSITQFAMELPILGAGLKGFSDAVTGIVPENIIAASTAAKALAEMTKCIPNEGGIVSWFAGDNSISKFGHELPVLGRGLKGFSDAVTGIVPENVIAASNAAKALAEMANVVPNEGGVVSWFAGDNSMSKFADHLPTLGKGLKGFSDAVTGIVPENVTAASNAAKTLAEMTAVIPNEGGVVAWFSGESSISKFSSELATLGGGLKNFSESVAGVVPENITAAANAAKALAEMVAVIPSEGGVVAWFTGESSITKFAGHLPTLGKGLKGFSDSIEGIVPENVTAAANAAKALAEMSQVIPNEGGVVAWFTGENSISKFAGHLPSLGKGLKGFSDSVKGIVPENVTAAADAAKSLGQMTDTIPGDTTKIIDFGENLNKFGTSLKSYFAKTSTITGEAVSNTKGTIDAVKEVSSIDASGMNSIADAVNEMADAVQNLSKVPEDAATKFGKALQDLGKTSVDGFVKELDEMESGAKKAAKTAMEAFVDAIESFKTKAEKACKDIVTACVEAIGGKKSSFTSAGKDLVEGFASGISANSYKAEAKAKAMAEAAVEAARKELDINSPSKVFRKMGTSVPEGFAMGIDKFASMAKASSTDMADEAISGVKSAISRISDVINSDIDAQPTIRPVLDLSDVRSGAGTISSLLGMGSSVGVLANVGAIGANMNKGSQNGFDSITSEIEKLNKNLKDMEHATYNINGISFSEGSDVEEAFKTILRAAKIDRRV